MWRLQGKPGSLPSDLTAWDVQCIALYGRNQNWSPEVIRSIPLRHWRYLPTLWEALAEMSNPDRPGNK